MSYYIIRVSNTYGEPKNITIKAGSISEALDKVTLEADECVSSCCELN